MKNVLLIAYHYPPVKVSSSVQRTLKFSQYLTQHGYQSQILTVRAKAAPTVSNEQMAEIPTDVVVHRCLALDAARHLALRGKYLDLLAMPDRWWSWILSGVWSGLRVMRKQHFDAIISTYPIASAHVIGYLLHRINKTPWISDFRDPMVDAVYPAKGLRRTVHRWIEQKAVKHSQRVLFTAPSALQLYAARYPDVPASTWCVVQNGYDEDSFAQAETIPSRATGARPLTLLHSGIIYPSERDPRSLLQALKTLKETGVISAKRLQVVLRATGHDHYVDGLIRTADIADIVRLQPSIPYQQALAEMLQVDALLVMQAKNCNHQIPAKVYEYFRAGKPIIALTDAHSDTAQLLRREGYHGIAALDQPEQIEQIITDLLQQGAEHAHIISHERLQPYTRRAQTKRLAEILDDVL